MSDDKRDDDLKDVSGGAGDGHAGMYEIDKNSEFAKAVRKNMKDTDKEQKNLDK